MLTFFKAALSPVTHTVPHPVNGPATPLPQQSLPTVSTARPFVSRSAESSLTASPEAPPQSSQSKRQLKAWIKTQLKRWAPLPVTYLKSWRLLFKSSSHLFTSGWFTSQLQGYPCRMDGTPIPWMNDAIVHFLEQRLTTDLTLFEYGSGYSTLFFGSRVKQVRAIEHVQDWQQTISHKAAQNTTVQHQPLDYDGDYCRAVHQTGQRYDVVVVDGRDRNRCAMQACEALSERGVILFDDTQREKYQAGIQFLRQRGFKQLEFRGLKPIDHASGQTSIFYRPNNCLGL